MTDAEDRWDSADLIRRLCYSLDTAKETIKTLGKKGFWHPELSNYRILPEKVIAETAFILLGAVEVMKYTEVKLRVNELAVMLCPYARNEKTLFNIAIYPAFALDYAYPHICLTKMGYPDQDFDKKLTTIINLNSKIACERIPYRIIEQEYIKELWKKPAKRIDEIVRKTSLGQSIDLLHCTSDDMYAFTHAMIYTSNFKIFLTNSPRNLKDILDEVDTMLVRCLDDQDYDLVAELLLSWPLTGAPWSIIALFAFHVLVAVENDVGFLPSRSIQTPIPKGITSQTRKDYLLATTYHTIYMMGYLCSTILKYNRNPIKRLPETSLGYPNSKAILTLFKNEVEKPHWLNIYNQLNENQKNSIIPLIFNILIIRNVKEIKLEFVYQVLKIGLDIGLVDTAIARQTAELIERINIISN